MNLLVIEIGGVRYALAAEHVSEVVRAVTIVPLPQAPAIVEGVIDVRGTLVPVLDIRARFRRPEKPLAHTDHLVLAWAGTRLVAIRADRALDVVRVDPSEVEDARAVVPETEYVAGVAKFADGLVLIHDLRTFLQEGEAEQLDRVVASAISGDGT